MNVSPPERDVLDLTRARAPLLKFDLQLFVQRHPKVYLPPVQSAQEATWQRQRDARVTRRREQRSRRDLMQTKKLSAIFTTVWAPGLGFGGFRSDLDVTWCKCSRFVQGVLSEAKKCHARIKNASAARKQGCAFVYLQGSFDRLQNSIARCPTARRWTGDVI